MFLGHEYSHTIRFVNHSELDARYSLLQQPSSTLPLYKYGSDPSHDLVVRAHGHTDVPVSIELYQSGPLSFEMVYQSSSGETHVPIGISAVGVGPSVRVLPARLEWNTVPVLQPIFRTISLKNESLIPAEFACALSSSADKSRAVFQIEPLKGVVGAGEERNISVNAFLNDAGTFTDLLKIDFMDAGSFEIPLSASGEGSCITIDDDESLNPFDLGALVRDQRYERAFMAYQK
jgi:hypothetical protein